MAWLVVRVVKVGLTSGISCISTIWCDCMVCTEPEQSAGMATAVEGPNCCCSICCWSSSCCWSCVEWGASLAVVILPSFLTCSTNPSLFWVMTMSLLSRRQSSNSNSSGVMSVCSDLSNLTGNFQNNMTLKYIWN